MILKRRASRFRLRSTLIATSAAVALLVAACGDTTNPEGAEDTSVSAVPPGQSSGDGEVTIERSRFSPTPLSIEAGTTVKFTNADPFAHTVTAAKGSDLDFSSGLMGENEKFEQKFDQAGTYRYFCEVHPTMIGTITVR